MEDVIMERREFLQSASAFTLAAQLPWILPSKSGAEVLRTEFMGTLVNDVHSALNPIWVRTVEVVQSRSELQHLVNVASKQDVCISIAGGRHAMGAQQFATDSILVDTTSLNRILSLDEERGLLKVEAGIQWKKLVYGLIQMQPDPENGWGVRQKQGGSDEICIGGTLSANAHGRALMMKPIVDDVESFELVNAKGELITISRTENSELFKLVIGGYGLFGIIYSVTLRLSRRKILRRVVEVIDIESLNQTIQDSVLRGAVYGDFQYDVDEKSDSFMCRGIFSSYEPVDPAVQIPTEQKKLSPELWSNLLYLAYTDRRTGFDLYCDHHVSTSGQLYWSDLSQMSTYDKGYRTFIDKKLGRRTPSSLMLSELYTPREKLVEFMYRAREILRTRNSIVIYGTIRMIQKDEETFLPWARENYACVIFNILINHTADGIANAADTFRALIDLSVSVNGSYYLTYHKWARKEQLLACYPQMPEFLEKKQIYDPSLVFQSDWYRHHHQMLS